MPRLTQHEHRPERGGASARHGTGPALARVAILPETGRLPPPAQAARMQRGCRRSRVRLGLEPSRDYVVLDYEGSVRLAPPHYAGTERIGMLFLTSELSRIARRVGLV